MIKFLRHLTGCKKQPSILSRADSYYRYISLQNIPVAERMAVLRLRAMQWAPFSNPRFSLVLQDGHAQIWCWNASLPLDLSRERVDKIVVETRLYPPPEDGQGVRLLICRNGLEGQVWRDNVLLASRWWSKVPESSQWLAFTRSAGISQDMQQPEPMQLSRLTVPWGKAVDLEGRGPWQWEVWILRLLPPLAAIVLGWQLGVIYQLEKAATDYEERHAQQSQQHEAILQQRSEFDNHLERINVLRGLWHSPSQLELLHTALNLMPGGTMDIVEWDFQAGSLGLVIQGDRLDPTNLVKAYSIPDWSDDVRVDKARQPNSMKVSIRIVRD